MQIFMATSDNLPGFMSLDQQDGRKQRKEEDGHNVQSLCNAAHVAQ